MKIEHRTVFVTLRNSYYAAMQQAARQARHEQVSGATTSAPQTYASMLADYPVLQEVSRLQHPSPADLDRAAEIFTRHGVLG